MKKLIVAILAIVPAISFASASTDGALQAEGFNFSAPAVPDTTFVSDRQTGMIVFDLGDNTFKGLDRLGNWNTMTTPGSSQVTSSGTLERIERLSIGTICTSSPCTIQRQSGSWVNNVTRTTTGTYVINIANDTFSEPPTCTIGTKESGVLTYFYSPAGTSAVYVATQDSTSTALLDGRFDLICMGAR